MGNATLHTLALRRAVERHQLQEWHIDQATESLFATTSDGKVLRIPDEAIEFFILGLMVGEA